MTCSLSRAHQRMQNSKTLSHRFYLIIKHTFPEVLGQKVMVACSGGVDSLSLLNLFYETAPKTKITPIACHVNHKLRESAAADAAIVESFCRERGILFRLTAFSDNFWQHGTKNVEETARNERYSLLVEVAASEFCQYIATGHTKDDQVETMLMRLFFQGTSPRGLAGIRKRATKNGTQLIRPILAFTRRELEEYIADTPTAHDETNNDERYLRNTIRKSVVPALTTILPENYPDHLTQLAESAQSYELFYTTLADTFWKGYLQTGKEITEYYIPRSDIVRYSREFWSAAFSCLFAEHLGRSHDAQAIADIIAFIQRRDAATASYHPFILIRNRAGVGIVRVLKEGEYIDSPLQ